eukprot:7564207-Pyramimonas_sp.AAC.1
MASGDKIEYEGRHLRRVIRQSVVHNRDVPNWFVTIATTRNNICTLPFCGRGRGGRGRGGRGRGGHALAVAVVAVVT